MFRQRKWSRLHVDSSCSVEHAWSVQLRKTCFESVPRLQELQLFNEEIAMVSAEMVELRRDLAKAMADMHQCSFAQSM